MSRLAGVCAAAVVLTACGESGGEHPGDIEILGGHAYSAVGPEAAAYVTFRNRGAVEDTLLSIASSFADTVTLHDTQQEGASLRMTPMGKLVVPAGVVVEMAPGSLHLMLTSLRMALPPGHSLPLRLQFAHAGLIETEVPISRYGDRQ